MEIGLVTKIMVVNRFKDISVRPVIITIISAGEIGEAIQAINNFS